MDEKQCKALKLNKQRCSRSAWGCKYCWQHRFSRLDDACWYNNAKIQAFIGLTGLMLAVVFFSYDFAFGPSKANQEKILRKLAEIDKKVTEKISPVLTKEDAERPLSADEEKIVVEYEKWKRIAEQANIKFQLSLDAQLSHAEALLRMAQYKDAETAFRTILAGHPDNTEAMNGLGIALSYDTAKYKEAEDLFRNVLSKDEASIGPNHPDVAMRLNNLAELLRVTGRFNEAEPLMRRALKIDESFYGPDNLNVAIRLESLAILLQATNRLHEAEPLYKRALKIFETSYGPDHPNVYICLNNLAELLRLTGQLNEAEPLMRRVLAIDEKSFGPNHPNVAIHLNNLAGLLKATNRFSEAKLLTERALKILETSYGPDHPFTVTVRNNLKALKKTKEQ